MTGDDGCGTALASVVLVLARLGFVASVLNEDLSTSRTCRLRNATPGRLRELTARNIDALDRVVDYLERHAIRLYRISSNLVPFASHPINGTAWWDDHAPQLDAIGRRLRRLRVRVSTHPGQYTVLNARNPAIVRDAVAELAYHARLLDALGTAASSKIVIHIGGLYGAGEREAMDRFVDAAGALPPHIRRRLVVENDDRLFDAEEALDVGRRAGIPVVFDWLHHRANPCRRPIAELLEEIFATWQRRDGPPKLHLSSQAADGPPGAHADYVAAGDMLALLEVTPRRPFDCMLEAKQKDRALLRLRHELASAGIAEAG